MSFFKQNPENVDPYPKEDDALYTRRIELLQLDPDYTYRDGYGVKWACVSGTWLREGYLLGFPYRTPPARYGPYTRIEEDTNHDQ